MEVARSSWQVIEMTGLLLFGGRASDLLTSSGVGVQLSFPFSLDKAVNALAYFADRGVKDLTKLKAVKLLYLADQYHFLTYGRPLSGDRYIAMDLGPVPESTYQLTTRLVEPDEVADEARETASRSLQVDKGFLYRHAYPVLRARRPPDMSVFSESEVEALDRTVREFGARSARQLVDLTHGHKAYKVADAGRAAGSSVPLPYEYFLQDATPDQAGMIRELATLEQENRDVASSLRAAARVAKERRAKTNAAG